jgi:hypothetical protein
LGEDEFDKRKVILVARGPFFYYLVLEEDSRLQELAKNFFKFQIGDGGGIYLSCAGNIVLCLSWVFHQQPTGIELRSADLIVVVLSFSLEVCLYPVVCIVEKGLCFV